MQTLLRTAALLLILAVVGSVAHAGARLTWRVADLDAAPLARVAAPVQRPDALDIAPILALAPFGARVVAAAPSPVASAGVRPDADWLLDLTLQGVIMAVPADRSFAMVAVKDQDVRTLAVGESPLKGVTVREVRRDGVLFTAGDDEVFLGFRNEDDKRAASLERQRNLIPQQFRGPAGGAASSAPRRSVDEVIDYYRQRIAANPQTVLDGFGVSRTDRGYEIGPTPSIGVTRAGLRSGDIIRAVNGEAVGTIEDDRRLFEKIAASGHARVEILRGGRRVILSFPLK